MLLKTVRHDGALWDVYLAAAEAPEADLALIFVADAGTDGRRASRTAPVDQELLEDLLREPFDVREDLLRAALKRADNGSRGDHVVVELSTDARSDARPHDRGEVER